MKPLALGRTPLKRGSALMKSLDLKKEWKADLLRSLRNVTLQPSQALSNYQMTECNFYDLLDPASLA
jgi:hypothetical protein